MGRKGHLSPDNFGVPKKLSFTKLLGVKEERVLPGGVSLSGKAGSEGNAKASVKIMHCLMLERLY